MIKNCLILLICAVILGGIYYAATLLIVSHVALVLIAEISPDLPVYILSENLTSGIIDEISGVEFAFFVQKPKQFNLKFFRRLFAGLGIRQRGNSLEEITPT